MRSFTSFLSLCFIGSLISTQSFTQTTKAPDIRHEPTLYVVPYAHLDTQWRWEFPQTISEYLLKTMRTNFYLIEKYPHYVFNWTGANRYRLMKEYFPSDYAKVKQYVDAGRWFPAGSSVEEGDVNLPSAEAIIRQVLYGNTYFRKEFGKASEEYMLPDCFGFPASLPSILAHAGVRGFSTQKLSAAWQPSPKVGGPGSVEATPEGIPFNVGIWEGPDGATVIAALNPGDYGSEIRGDLSKPPIPPTAQQLAALTPQQREFVQSGRFRGDENWVERIDLDGEVTGVFADYHYIGTGDIGGSVNEESVKLLEAMATKGMAAIPPMQLFGRRAAAQASAAATPEVRMGDGPVHVIPATADQMFKDIKPEMTAKMPRYKGDLELINHSAGSLTSQAAHKRWIRRSEILADAAEKASLAAEWLGARPYPQERLNNAWTLVMGGHFHDTGAGTATPKAYEYAQNDDIIALNQFAAVLTDATAAVASGLDTQTQGTPIVVYNSLNIVRQDVVKAKVAFPSGAPKAVRVTGPDGAETPAQLEGDEVIFLANVPSAGYAVYSVEAASAPSAGNLKVFAPQGGGFRGGTPGPPASLENARYRVTVDSAGDISSIFDKSLDKELLSAPIRLAISNDHPREWPAWNMDFDQEQAQPRLFVRGGRIRIAENGPARVALEVTRQTEGSKYVQTISLAAGGAGNRVEIRNSVDWGTMLSNVKAVFALTASNSMATYNWGLGTIQRPNAAERSFEVASHQWIDLTDKSGAYGATILTDYQNGSDKRDDQTIRLTLLRSPGTDNGYTDQANQDFGHHDFAFGITGHKGDWREAQTDWQGQRLNAPLIAFETVKHPGAMGKTFSLVNVDNPRIQVMALKKAELSDEVVIRMVELDGKPQANVHVKFPGSVTAAREVNGQELPVGRASVEQGYLVTSFTAYQPRSFAVKLAPAAIKIAAVRSQPLDFAYDLSVASNDDTATAGGGMDGKGNAYPAEMMSAKIDFDGVGFRLAPARTGAPNATAAKGQKVALPIGTWNRVYLLAASADGDQTATFAIDDRPLELTVESWGGMIGQADTRLWRNDPYTAADWAVSANHAKWNPDPAKQRDPSQAKRDWGPRYPEDFAGMQPGFIKPAAAAWFASHHHTPEGLNQPYSYSYVFAYEIDVPQNAKNLTLPNNDKVRVLAISIAEQAPRLKAAQSLY